MHSESSEQHNIGAKQQIVGDSLVGILPSEVRAHHLMRQSLDSSELRHLAIILVLFIFAVPTILATGGATSLFFCLLVIVFFFCRGRSAD
jgi:predicted ABC-type exoprotein transport system permease subunit